MGADGGSIVVGNTLVEEGRALFDTETGSVLWIVLIGDGSIALEPAGRYGGELLLSADRFKTRVAGGRFELESRPPGVAP